MGSGTEPAPFGHSPKADRAQGEFGQCSQGVQSWTLVPMGPFQLSVLEVLHCGVPMYCTQCVEDELTALARHMVHHPT